MKFSIKIEEIFHLEGKGHVILGDANANSYIGKLKCDNIIIEVIGYQMFPTEFNGKAALLIKDFLLTEDFIGKTFYQVVN